jgi:hypothetical protein
MARILQTCGAITSLTLLDLLPGIHHVPALDQSDLSWSLFYISLTLMTKPRSSPVITSDYFNLVVAVKHKYYND